MTAYVDDAQVMWRGKYRYHLVADSLDELHQFCKDIGVKRCWYHAHRRHPHYDITGPQRDAAIAAGAVPVDGAELVRLARQLRR